MTQRRRNLFDLDPAPGPDCLPTLLIIGYVNDDLSEAEQVRVTTHLATCSYCQAEIASLRAAIQRREERIRQTQLTPGVTDAPLPAQQIATMAQSHWQTATEGWQHLKTKLEIRIAPMRAWFQSIPPGLQLQPATVAGQYRSPEAKSWSLTIPEEEGQTGYTLELKVFSASGQRAELTLSLLKQPGNQPAIGVTVTLRSEMGSPMNKPTDENGTVAWQLAPGIYEVAITDADTERRFTLEIGEERL